MAKLFCLSVQPFPLFSIFTWVDPDADPQSCGIPVTAGLWIRIKNLADPDPAVFLNANPDLVNTNL